MAPYGTGDGSWGERVCWCTEYGALTRRNVKKVSWRRLLEPAMAAGVREYVAALQLEH